MRCNCGKLGALFTGVKAGGGCFRRATWRSAALPELADLLAHFGGLGPVRMVLEEIFEIVGGGGAIAAPEMDLRQEKLGVREMRRIDFARRDEVLLGQLHLPQLEVSHAELRVGQRIPWTDQH